MEINKFYEELSSEQLNLLKEYLFKRYELKKTKRRFSVVFDILHQCDLNCRGCGTNATYTQEKSVHINEPAFSDIIVAFDKIKEYADYKNFPVFINIGGGEPFLRDDIHQILSLASDYFGCDGVGVDTNGTLDNSIRLISNVIHKLSYVGISINGLEEYHNWWAGNNRINAFQRSMSVVKELCSDQSILEKVEVTSVASKKNIDQLPDLMDRLADIGVKNYSIHRAMPIGRMAKHPELVPSAKDYLHLLIAILERSKKNELNVHLHHSIESIHATLLLDLETYTPDKIGNPDMGSSLGIEPEGYLVFDPWCTTGVWKKLSGGNIFKPDTSLIDILDGEGGTVFDLARIYTAPHLRCNGCIAKCSGGSRIAAAANLLNAIKSEEVTENHILNAMIQIDPACPLYKE